MRFLVEYQSIKHQFNGKGQNFHKVSRTCTDDDRNE